jgi:peptidoglycan glycosyltransferase
VRGRARAGAALCRALAGQPAELGGFSATDLQAFQPTALLEATLLRGALPETVRLAEMAERGGESFAPVYRAAALLEAGREPEAREVAAGAAGLLRWHRLGRRLEQALAWRSAGAETLLWDRSGELVGALDAAGMFHRATDVAEAWLPPGLAEDLSDRPAGVRLGLDLELAQRSLAALGPYRGSVVLLDPRDGTVRVAVSDPRTLRREPRAAFEQRREPASIAKLITTTATLRAGLDPDAEIARMTCRGSESYQGGTLWCPYRAGPLHGLDQALAVSCNIAFANLGIRVGRQALLEEYRRYRFGGEGALPASWAGRVLQPEGTERQLADLAIGLEATDITPLHAALLAAVFADDGVMPEPTLVTAETGPLGLARRRLRRPPRGHRVIEPSWLETMRRAMRAVTGFGGTAAGLAPPGLSVAMKTGTASEWHHGYHVNYIGFLPAEAPEVAFCIRITHQATSRRVNRAAREVTARLLADLGDWLEREASSESGHGALRQ